MPPGGITVAPLKRLFWSIWNGPTGTVVMSVIAIAGFVLLGREMFGAVRLTCGTLFGVGLGWRIRRKTEAGRKRREEKAEIPAPREKWLD